MIEFDTKESTSLYIMDVMNQREKRTYNALKLKQDLDNLNFYDNLFSKLDAAQDYYTANDTFYNYIDFLENKIDADNFLKYIGKQPESGTNVDGCS